MQVKYNSQQIARMLDNLADQIMAALPEGQKVALVGIRSRGEILASRLLTLLRQRGLGHADLGALDIALYRDDLNSPGVEQIKVRTTEIDFNVDGQLIILVDDVLNTGRSIRAALDALVDLGRPRAIWLTVLIDRGQRELPICADFVGDVVDVPRAQKIQVYLQDVDQREEIVLE